VLDSDVPLDPFGRTPIADGMKRQITDTFAMVPEGKRGALLVVADEQGARAVLAAKFGEHWKIAGGGGVPWTGEKPTGWIGVIGSW
jgi:hypothetical protein